MSPWLMAKAMPSVLTVEKSHHSLTQVGHFSSVNAGSVDGWFGERRISGQSSNCETPLTHIILPTTVKDQ
jgi:hypothetical protein